jgi:hypothetical protein
MIIATRLTSQGVFQIQGEFDEVSRTTIGSNSTSVFAKEFDEITINPITNGLAKRETKDGIIMVSGYFDEQITLS